MPRPPERAVSSRDESVASCAAPGCRELLSEQRTGRPARYCSDACRSRAYREHRRARGPVTVEADIGSASSRGRRPEDAWLVRLRRDNKTVVVTIGLHKAQAEHLAEQITEILT
ncbi:MAG TPA: hypothetical protein VND62_00010 [Acidimicrobiales bacterium]|nr:hypothetical protein [Acidimicrobiales bacterium]